MTLTLTELLKNVVGELTQRQMPFALAGGLVASLYRQSPRMTNDVDVALFGPEASERTANEIIRSFGMEPHSLRKAQLDGGPLFAIKKKSTPVQIIAGRASDADSKPSIGLDLLLPALPWVEDACAHAQSNRVDFGFGPIPCLTVEDLIVSKLYALKNQSTRFTDLDDLKSIFEANHELSLDYLGGRILALKLSLPELILPYAPPRLKKLISQGSGP
jgi:hypothetical protein